MPYTLTIGIAAGSSQVGVPLRAVLNDSADNPYGSPITTGFHEEGEGNYHWTHDFDDAFRGIVRFENDDTDELIAIYPINPEIDAPAPQTIPVGPDGIDVDWLPSVNSIGALLRARTLTTAGVEIGTFTSDTRPTDSGVALLIGQAASALSEDIGAEIPESVWPAAKSLTRIGAAMLVELSYFPEQIGTNRSPYIQLERMYDKRLKSLMTAVEQAGGGDEPGSVDDAQLPSYGGFPTTAIGMEFPW